jgi:beta-phosphoglucomutase-like phosphatase (HAD superfamily)
MALTLGKTGLQDYFGDRIFSASDVARGKPAPDLFLHAARTLGYSPAHCIVVEDSLPGVQAGVAAGMQVCALGSAHEISADVHWFLCMAELPAILVSLQERYFMDRNRDANIIDAR